MKQVESADRYEMPIDPIRVYVNGEPRQIQGVQTVSALLTVLNIPLERVAIELNQSIVRKREWESTLVGADAHVEIVEFVGGG